MENEPNEKKDKAPFGEFETSDLVGNSVDFYNIINRPDVVVRKIAPINKNKEERNTSLNELIKDGNNFKKFAERYGIKMADTHYFFGNDPDFKTGVPKEEQPAFMAVTDRIAGQNLDEMREFDEKATVEIDAMFSGLFRSLHDSFNENGIWWTDFYSGQIMYGTAPNSTEPHLYIVDVDPWMKDWVGGEYGKDQYFWECIILFNEMRALEPKIAGGNKQFQKARETLSDIITEMPVSEKAEVIEERKRLIDTLKNN